MTCKRIEVNVRDYRANLLGTFMVDHVDLTMRRATYIKLTASVAESPVDFNVVQRADSVLYYPLDEFALNGGLVREYAYLTGNWGAAKLLPHFKVAKEFEEEHFILENQQTPMQRIAQLEGSIREALHLQRKIRIVDFHHHAALVILNSVLQNKPSGDENEKGFRSKSN